MRIHIQGFGSFDTFPGLPLGPDNLEGSDFLRFVLSHDLEWTPQLRGVAFSQFRRLLTTLRTFGLLENLTLMAPTMLEAAIKQTVGSRRTYVRTLWNLLQRYYRERHKIEIVPFPEARRGRPPKSANEPIPLWVVADYGVVVEGLARSPLLPTSLTPDFMVNGSRFWTWGGFTDRSRTGTAEYDPQNEWDENGVRRSCDAAAYRIAKWSFGSELVRADYPLLPLGRGARVPMSYQEIERNLARIQISLGELARGVFFPHGTCSTRHGYWKLLENLQAPCTIKTFTGVVPTMRAPSPEELAAFARQPLPTDLSVPQPSEQIPAVPIMMQVPVLPQEQEQSAPLVEPAAASWTPVIVRD